MDGGFRLHMGVQHRFDPLVLSDQSNQGVQLLDRDSGASRFLRQCFQQIMIRLGFDLFDLDFLNTELAGEGQLLIVVIGPGLIGILTGREQAGLQGIHLPFLVHGKGVLLPCLIPDPDLRIRIIDQLVVVIVQFTIKGDRFILGKGLPGCQHPEAALVCLEAEELDCLSDQFVRDQVVIMLEEIKQAPLPKALTGQNGHLHAILLSEKPEGEVGGYRADSLIQEDPTGRRCQIIPEWGHQGWKLGQHLPRIRVEGKRFEIRLDQRLDLILTAAIPVDLQQPLPGR